MPELIHRRDIEDTTGDFSAKAQRREVRTIYFPLRLGVFAGDNPSLISATDISSRMLKRIET